MRYVFLLYCCLSGISYANVALDQLNARLAEKESMRGQVKSVSPALKELSEHYDLVLIYKGNCPHCKHFAPILKDFSNTFKVRLKAYHLNGETLTDLNSESLTPKLFQSFYTTGGYKPIVPALFLLNKETLEAYPVLFGEASPYELAKRVNELMQKLKERFDV